jgi:hypothetical protein
MYESTPQHLIDEESHPGVLADMLGSGSSSSNSSSSDSDSNGSDTHSVGSVANQMPAQKRCLRYLQESELLHAERIPTASLEIFQSPTTLPKFRPRVLGALKGYLVVMRQMTMVVETNRMKQTKSHPGTLALTRIGLRNRQKKPKQKKKSSDRSGIGKPSQRMTRTYLRQRTSSLVNRMCQPDLLPR